MTIKFPYSADQAAIVSHIINARVSVLQTNMVGRCVPTEAELENIFKGALSVPDHGQMHPARFIVIKGDKVDAYIKHMYAVKIADNSNFVLSEAEYAKNFAGVGMFIIAYAAIVEGKVKAYEQEWSVAASVQNMMNLFYAYGYAAKWNSIFKEKDTEFKKYLGVHKNWVSMGYLMVGKSADTAKQKSRENFNDHFKIL